MALHLWDSRWGQEQSVLVAKDPASSHEPAPSASLSPVLASDDSLAAILAHDVDRVVGSRLLVCSVPQLAFSFSPPGDDICGFAWLPGTHTMLVLGRGKLARLAVEDLQSASPLELFWSLASHAAGPRRPCMDLLPDGSTVVILQSSGWGAGSLGVTYNLSQYDTADLRHRTCASFSLPGAALPAAQQGHASVHCTVGAVAACFAAGVHGTRVHALHEGIVGPLIFSAPGLWYVSWSHGYLAGVRFSREDDLY